LGKTIIVRMTKEMVNRTTTKHYPFHLEFLDLQTLNPIRKMSFAFPLEARVVTADQWKFYFETSGEQ